MNILVLMEDKDTADLLTIFAEKHGHSVTDVKKMDNIWEILAVAPPDIIFSDLTLPMLGEDYMIKLIKSNPASKHIKVVLISGHSDLKKIAKQCGADDYLMAPFTQQQLLRLLEMHKAEAEKK